MLEIKVSNIYSHISGKSPQDYQVLVWLDKMFSVEIPGAKYSENYKKKRWDGLEHFFNLKNKLILTGLLPDVMYYLTHSPYGEYPFIIEDFRVNLPKFTPIISKTLGHLTLRPYQYEAVIKANNYIADEFYFPRGIIDGATNTGKSAIFSSILTHIEDVKGLVFIHKKTTFDQLVDDLSKFFPRVGIVNSEQCNFEDITVCMQETVFSKIKKNNEFVLDNMQNYNTVIVDECHTAGSDTYQKVLSNIDAGARFFVSGTALENKDMVKNVSIKGQSGDILYSISNKDLEEYGVSRKAIIKIYNNPTPAYKYSSYQEEQKAVIEESEERINLMLDLIEERLDKYILISCTKVTHGLKMYKAIQQRFPQVRSAFIHGDSKDRKYRLEDFKQGKLEILIASMILKEGVNIPIIDTLIYTSGGESIISSKQVIGRALRAKEGHSTVEIIDFYDRGRWVEKHSLARLATYEREKFEVIKYF